MGPLQPVEVRLRIVAKSGLVFAGLTINTSGLESMPVIESCNWGILYILELKSRHYLACKVSRTPTMKLYCMILRTIVFSGKFLQLESGFRDYNEATFRPTRFVPRFPVCLRASHSYFKYMPIAFLVQLSRYILEL